MAVVLFHAGFQFRGFGLHGGYVGVDVFFVISGYLITSLIWRDLEKGTFSFVNFMERRVRRIVPALVVVTIATLAAGWFLLLPQDFASLGRAAASQSVFAANIHYWRDSGYFAGAAGEKPLLHTWSLAVEEQFYLVVPVLLWGLYLLAKHRARRAVVLFILAAFASSLATSIYGIPRFPSATFYLLPTRAWELLLGALIAFLPSSPLLRGRNQRDSMVLVGLAFILLPVFLYDTKTPFPGLAALPPCLGAALIIYAVSQDERIPTLTGRLLSLRLPVFIGAISYSLYLWHWPFFAFTQYLSFTPVPASQRLLMLALGFLFAILSWKYVETPFRNRVRGTASRQSVFAFAGVGLATILIFGLLCERMHGFPSRLPPQAQEYAKSALDMVDVKQPSIEDINAGKLVEIGRRNSKLRPSLLVWGDSHAIAALPAVDRFLKEKGLSGRAVAYLHTMPVLNWFYPSIYGLDKKSIDYNNAILGYIEKNKVPDVILIARFEFYNDSVGKDANNSVPLGSALLETVRRIVSAGSRPWIMLGVPYPDLDVPRALSRSVITHQNLAELCPRPQEKNVLQEDDPQIFAKIKAAGGRILDPKPRFLDPTGQYYIIQSNGVSLYRDTNHLTARGAEIMLTPFFRDSLKINQPGE